MSPRFKGVRGRASVPNRTLNWRGRAVRDLMEMVVPKTRVVASAESTCKSKVR